MASDRIFPGAQKWARTKIQQREAERYPPFKPSWREKQTTMAMNMEIEKETKEKMKKKILNETKCAAEEREQIEMVMMMMMMMIVGAIQKKR